MRRSERKGDRKPTVGTERDETRPDAGREEPSQSETRSQRDGARRLEQRRAGMRGEARPARAMGEERPETSSALDRAVPPEHEPGTTGRPTRKQTAEFDAEAASQEEQAQGGTNRSPKIVNPSRKRKIA